MLEIIRNHAEVVGCKVSIKWKGKKHKDWPRANQWSKVVEEKTCNRIEHDANNYQRSPVYLTTGTRLKRCMWPHSCFLTARIKQNKTQIINEFLIVYHCLHRKKVKTFQNLLSNVDLRAIASENPLRWTTCWQRRATQFKKPQYPWLFLKLLWLEITRVCLNFQR